jgi:surfeit locus 1 family protein
VSRYRWAFRPGFWLFSHVFVATCIFLFIWAGLWQISRLHGRREANDLIAAREQLAPVPIGTLLPMHADDHQLGESTFRHVTVTGTYRVADQVLINNRSNSGEPGYWVVTPLVQADGTAVVINRGWIPLTVGDSGSTTAFPTTTGPVTVTGMIRLTQTQEGLGASDPPTGVLAKLARVDVPRLQQQVAVPLYPVYLDLVTQDPPQPAVAPSPIALPEPTPAPVLDDGPHLDYAEQWFAFATLTIIVYPLLLRRTAKHKEIDARQAEIDAREAALGATDPLAATDGDAVDRVDGLAGRDGRREPVG